MTRPPCIPHILCRRGREPALANSIHSPLRTHTEEGIRRKSEAQRERRSTSVVNKTVNLITRPTFLGLQGNLCCRLAAQHRELSAIVPVFQCVT